MMIDRERCRAAVDRRQCTFRGTEDVPVTVMFNRGRRFPPVEMMLSVCRPHRHVLEREGADPMPVVGFDSVYEGSDGWQRGRPPITASIRRARPSN